MGKMYGGKVRVVDLKGEPKDLGRAHGTELSGHIRRYLADRLGLSADSVWSGQVVDRETVLHLAAGTLSHHEQYSEALHEEMLAMAEAAGITPAEAVVVGGFTDLIDLVRAYSGRAPTEDECTALIDPVNGVLAQTWDMHASAGEHVVLLRIEPREGPVALVQTTAGCLGQIGMNEAGISVGINNLTSWAEPE